MAFVLEPFLFLCHELPLEAFIWGVATEEPRALRREHAPVREGRRPPITEKGGWTVKLGRVLSDNHQLVPYSKFVWVLKSVSKGLNLRTGTETHLKSISGSEGDTKLMFSTEERYRMCFTVSERNPREQETHHKVLCFCKNR